MSNRMKIKVRPIKIKQHKPQPEREGLHISFNIFTRDGENLEVKSPRPMTLAEAQYHFKALSISAKD